MYTPRYCHLVHLSVATLDCVITKLFQILGWLSKTYFVIAKTLCDRMRYAGTCMLWLPIQVLIKACRPRLVLGWVTTREDWRC